MAWLISIRDLQWRRRRFAIAVIATALVFALSLVLSGVSASFDNEIDRTVDSFEADAWLVRAGTLGPFTAPTTMPAARVESVRRLPGVRRADPVLILGATTTTPEARNVNLVGVVPGGTGSPRAISEDLRSPRAAVVDERLGLDTGDRLDLNGARLRVTGVTNGMTYFAGIPRVTLPLEEAQRLGIEGRPLATAIVTQGRPRTVPRELTMLSNAEVAEDLARPIREAKDTIRLIRGLLWVVAAGIIGAIVYLSVLERVGDFAVLKAVGTSTRGSGGGPAAAGVPALNGLGGARDRLRGGDRSGGGDACRAVHRQPADPARRGRVGRGTRQLLGLRRAVAVDPAQAFAGSR